MGLLVDEDEGAGNEEQDGQADGIGHPDEGCCYERHGRVQMAPKLGQAGVSLPVGLVVLLAFLPQARAWEREEDVEAEWKQAGI